MCIYLICYSDLNEALLILPYSVACDVLKMLPKLLKRQYQIELVTKLALSLIQAHHNPIVASQELLPTLEEVRKLAMEQISTLRVRYFLILQLKIVLSASKQKTF